VISSGGKNMKRERRKKWDMRRKKENIYFLNRKGIELKG
jgi:hypothetical protein